MNHPTTPGPDPLLARLDAVIDGLKAIRARRWLDQYPPGHSERPNPPDYVREYERRRTDTAERNDR